MEEQKKSHGGLIAIIIIACVFVFIILPIAAVGFFWLGWGSIKQSINNQWETISKENGNSKVPIIEDDYPTTSNEVKLDKTINGKVVIYFFRGEGCSHCSEAEAWFESIKADYGSMFIIKDYETWYNQDNAEYMQKVAESRDEEANGVPYIIVGDKSWLGFTQSYGDEIISEIKRIYELY